MEIHDSWIFTLKDVNGYQERLSKCTIGMPKGSVYPSDQDNGMDRHHIVSYQDLFFSLFITVLPETSRYGLVWYSMHSGLGRYWVVWVGTGPVPIRLMLLFSSNLVR